MIELGWRRRRDQGRGMGPTEAAVAVLKEWGRVRVMAIADPRHKERPLRGMDFQSIGPLGRCFL